MLDRLRQSLAFKLAVQYALVFALASGVLFAALYWTIGRALEAREQRAVEQQAESLASAYELGNIDTLRAQLAADPSPEVKSYFIRLLDRQGRPILRIVPTDWIETQIERIPIRRFGRDVGTISRPVEIERIPQNAFRDYAIAWRELVDGNILQVGRLTDSRSVLLGPLQRAFALSGISALILSVAVGTILAWRATKPLRAVSDTTRRILETGALEARVPTLEGRDELANLVRQLNTLLDKNSAHVRVLRETLDNLAHDLRTPLTRLRGTAELALQGSSDPAEARAALADCVNESDRVLHLLETLLDVSAAEAGALKLNRDRIDLRSVVERSVDLYREVAEERKIEVVVNHPAPVEVDADAIRLGQAVNNLVDNALKYTPSGGRVEITARNETNAAVLSISDTGPGVPVAERESIFRRLYRSDSSRSQRGFGLGLSLVKAIVEAHGGTVVVVDGTSGGARFIVRLPR
jgi:signal transduction histidine kinase